MTDATITISPAMLERRIAQARNEGAEEMRERAARRVEGLKWATDHGWKAGANKRMQFAAEEIRALPPNPSDSGERS